MKGRLCSMPDVQAGDADVADGMLTSRQGMSTTE